MANEGEVEVVVETEVETEGEQEIETPKEGEKEVEKVQETPEAKRARLKRQLEQLDKKFPEQKVEKKESKKDSFDYGEKAFLIANNIKEAEEMDLVKEIMKSTGKSLDDVVASKYFQAELKEIREVKASDAALPAAKRNGENAQGSVEYWVAKGELPPADQIELRQKVVNARIGKETSKNVFTSNPVIQ